MLCTYDEEPLRNGRTMPIKSDRWIREQAAQHRMIEPFSEKQVASGVISCGLSSYSYGLRVSSEFKILTNVNSATIDPKAFDERSFVPVEAESVVIPPNSFALARSVEYFRIPRDVFTICVGKSTYARCWIIVNATPVDSDGRDLSRLRYPTPRRCRQRSTPTKVCARFCFSSQTKSAKPAIPTGRANIKSSKESCSPKSKRVPLSDLHGCVRQTEG